MTSNEPVDNAINHNHTEAQIPDNTETDEGSLSAQGAVPSNTQDALLVVLSQKSILV
jgi:hypothetical protein